MPTPVTHGVVGIICTGAVPQGVSKGRCAVVFATISMLPDLDLLGMLMGVHWLGTFGHRGITHSLLAAIGLGVMGAMAIRGVSEWEPGVQIRVVGLSVCVAASHGILDASTNLGVGVGLFMPLSDARVLLPVRPILVATSEMGLGETVLRMMGAEVISIWLPLIIGLLCLRSVLGSDERLEYAEAAEDARIVELGSDHRSEQRQREGNCHGDSWSGRES